MPTPYRIIPVSAEHVPAITAILKVEVEQFTNNFDWVAPTEAEVAHKVEVITKRFPWFVLLCPGDNGEVVAGFAYASSFRDKASYAYTAETTIYLAEAFHGKGLAAPLYQQLLTALEAQGLKTLIACITMGNEASVRFHERLGFVKTGEIPRAGFKFGRWLDIGWWVKVVD